MSSGPAPAPLVVVLVEPAGPLNVGSVARLCANFGVAELRLVAPRCDPTGEEARRMAVHGAGMLERARLFPTLAAALADCRRVVASSGRCSGEPLPLHDPATALAWLRQPASSAATALSPLALVFGREDHGLSNEELLQAGRLLCIDTAGSYGSLNLAQAAAIVLHQWQQLSRPHPASPPASPPPSQPPSAPAPWGPDPCERASLEAMLADAEALLLEVGFLYPHTAAARMAKLRALLQRSQPGDGEVALLRGMVRQLRWASQRPGGRPGQTP